MIIYIAASLKMDPNEPREKILTSWLHTGFKQFTEGAYTIEITKNPFRFPW